MRQIISSSVLGVRLAIVVLVCYWTVIFVGTHIPKISVPSFNNADKIYHLTAFAGLGFLLAWALPKNHRGGSRHLVAAFAIASVYGIFDELSQLLVRGRTADVWDFVADVMGAIVGLVAYSVTRSLILGQRHTESPCTSRTSKARTSKASDSEATSAESSSRPDSEFSVRASDENAEAA